MKESRVYWREMRDCTPATSKTVEWTANGGWGHRHSTQLSVPQSQTGSITCEFTGGPREWSPNGGKSWGTASVTVLADRGTDGPTSKQTWEFGVPTLGLPMPLSTFRVVC